MKIGIITFHGAHNYGSMLQNYALQRVLIDMGHTPFTINYRTLLQKEMYDPFISVLKLKNKKRILVSLFLWPYKKCLRKKYQKFENFLTHKIALTEECNESLSSLPAFDAYIAGSDQIWNLNTRDFDWKYFLDFAPDKAIKISYAASLGPSPSFVKYLNGEIEKKLKENLGRFDAISVRDIDSAEALAELTGIHNIEISLDPSLLLTKDVWNSIIPQERLVKEDYIFLYNPIYDKSVYDAAKILSKTTRLPIYVSNQNIRSVVHSLTFNKKLDAGPLDFLNLIKNAQYVIGKSFHLVAFSIIFQVKFIAVNGLADSRIKQLLNTLMLEKCATSSTHDIISVLMEIEGINFNVVHEKLIKIRYSSLGYLDKMLPR